MKNQERSSFRKGGTPSPEEMINSLTRSEWSTHQKDLCRAVIEKTLSPGTFTAEEVAGIILGMTIGGPLGKGCPDWRVRAIKEHIVSGPNWERSLWGLSDGR